MATKNNDAARTTDAAQSSTSEVETHELPVVQRTSWHQANGKSYSMISMPLQSSKASRAAAF